MSNLVWSSPPNVLYNNLKIPICNHRIRLGTVINFAISDLCETSDVFFSLSLFDNVSEDNRNM